MSTKKTFALATLAFTAFIGCRANRPPDRSDLHLNREDFNRRAAEKFLPLFWREDRNKDGVLQPNELAILWGYGDTERSHWINAEDQFTPHFEEAYIRQRYQSERFPHSIVAYALHQV